MDSKAELRIAALERELAEIKLKVDPPKPPRELLTDDEGPCGVCSQKNEPHFRERHGSRNTNYEGPCYMPLPPPGCYYCGCSGFQSIDSLVKRRETDRIRYEGAHHACPADLELAYAHALRAEARNFRGGGLGLSTSSRIQGLRDEMIKRGMPDPWSPGSSVGSYRR